MVKMQKYIFVLKCVFVAIIFLCLSTCKERSLSDSTSSSSHRNSIEITHYAIHINFPESNDRLQIAAEIQLRTSESEDKIGQPIDFLLCDKFKGTKIENLRIEDDLGNPLNFVRQESRISITAPTEKLVIIYDLLSIGTQADDPYGPMSLEISKDGFHINAAVTRTDNWFPKISGNSQDRLSLYNLTIEVPSHFQVMASGHPIGMTTKGSRSVFEFQNYEGVTDRSLFVFAGVRRLVSKEFPDGIKVQLFVPDHSLEENISTIMDVVHKSYAFFTKTFGQAFNEYRVWSFAYGYAGLFNAMGAPTSIFTDKIQNNEIFFPVRNLIHEVSHAWWGNIVAVDVEKEYWLIEAFGKYSEIIGINPAVESDVERESFSRLKLAVSPYLEATPSIHEAGSVESRNLQVASAYNQGAMFLNVLRFIMGQDAFFNGIRDYVATFKGQRYVTTSDFLQKMQSHSPVSLERFFDDYVMKKGFVRYQLTHKGVRLNGAQVIHRFELKNVSDKIFYVPIRLKSDLVDRTETLEVTAGDSKAIEVESSNDQEMPSVTIDPEGHFPVLEESIRGAGGLVYRASNNGPVKFTSIEPQLLLWNAGIRDNMTLIKVNNHDVTNLDIHQLNDLFLQRKGTTLSLVVSELPTPIALIY